jgi:hypothetical protein
VQGTHAVVPSATVAIDRRRRSGLVCKSRSWPYLCNRKRLVLAWHKFLELELEEHRSLLPQTIIYSTSAQWCTQNARHSLGSCYECRDVIPLRYSKPTDANDPCGFDPSKFLFLFIPTLHFQDDNNHNNFFQSESPLKKHSDRRRWMVCYLPVSFV